MPIVQKQAFLANGGAAGSILTTLRRAGIPVAGLGVAAAPKRRGLPVRLSGADLGRVVMHNFFGVMVPYAGVEDEMGYWANSWAVARGNSTGYACDDLQRDPSTAAGQLQDIAAAHCGLAPEACTGIDVPGLASQLASEYAAWFSATFPKGWGDCYNYDAATWAAKFPGAVQFPNGGPILNTAPSAPTGGGSETGYTIPNTVTPNYGTPVVITGGGGTTAAAPASGSGPASGGSAPVRVSLRNASRPNMPLAVGDRFELVITGSPNAPVSIDATRNGSQRGVSSFGSTDSSGNKIITSVMSEAEIGRWSETISVGAASASIQFEVAAAPTMTAGGPASSGGSTNTGGGGTTATNVPGSTGGPDFLPVASGLPSWVLPAAIAAAAVLMLRK